MNANDLNTFVRDTSRLEARRRELLAQRATIEMELRLVEAQLQEALRPSSAARGKVTPAVRACALDLVERGRSYREISRALGISPATISMIVNGTYTNRKLQAV